FSLTNNVLINEKYEQKDTLKAKDTQHVVEKK
ncbi:MAG: hypothetical protein RL265_1236, partial [Bacteroidota bacterium]